MMRFTETHIEALAVQLARRVDPDGPVTAVEREAAKDMLAAIAEADNAASVPGRAPDSVTDPLLRDLYGRCDEMRRAIKEVAAKALDLRRQAVGALEGRIHDGEIIANTVLTFRHLEDASMRLGKALQHLDGGVSVYDRGSTVGA